MTFLYHKRRYLIILIVYWITLTLGQIIAYFYDPNLYTQAILKNKLFLYTTILSSIFTTIGCFIGYIGDNYNRG